MPLSNSDLVARLAAGRLKKRVHGPPVFTEEGPQYYKQAFRRNKRFAEPGPYQTHLGAQGEAKFQAWAGRQSAATGIQVPTSGKTDYDYRGYFKKHGGDVVAGHFSDRFKTPYDTSFSSESKYATRDNPLVWRGDKLVNRRTGRVVYR